MKLTEYHITNEKISGRKTFAVISDLHGCDPKKAISLLESARPDYILAPGDIFERLDGSCESKNGVGFKLLKASSNIAPTFYSMGNHEIGGTRSWALGISADLRGRTKCECSEENLRRMTESGARLLDDSYLLDGGFAFGGLSSGILNEGGKPALAWLDEFCRAGCPKVLLCHHPEYYQKYLIDRDIDIIVSGHAHGGQWRFFGRGLFAPGQGIFPKYTSGVYNGHLVVGRGLKKSGLIPRIFNPTEVVLVIVN